MSTEYDLVVRGGTVFDGTGSAPVTADVAIRDGHIVEVGTVTRTGREEIHAHGRWVTPGFVDVHTHYDGQITWENSLAPSSEHGVTSVVMGNCGVGFAPAREQHRDIMVRLMEGVEDIPEVVMTTGVPWNWETFPQYLDALDQRTADIDFCAQVPHGPLRVYVMGQRGADLEPPTDHDLAEMRRLTTEAVKAGAVGVSTSRTFGHRFKDGTLSPAVSSEDTEVLTLADGLRDAGQGVFQLVPNTEHPPTQQLELLRGIVERSGRPTSFTFQQSPYHPDGWQVLLAGLEQLEQEGHTIRGQIIPRPTGALLGLGLSFHPFSLSPSFRPIAHLPLHEKVAAMRDPALRERLLSEAPDDPNAFYLNIISALDSLFILGDPPQYHPSPEDSIAARAARENRRALEAIYDALLQRDGREILYRPMANTGGERFEGAGRAMLRHDQTVIALGDGGAHYSMICDAAYPTYFLTYWVRDAHDDKRVEPELAIKMLTTEPAALVGLLDRGQIHPGYKADLNIIDIDRLHLHAPHPVYDLPAGGRRLRQLSDGYDATILSGVVTYRHGTPTGHLPGRLIRGAQPAPTT